MGLTVRRVEFDSECPQLLEVLERNLGGLPHSQRLTWLYNKNPCGRALSWFACVPESQRIVGLASVFPRAMWVGDQVSVCGQVGDFAIDPSHRSLGPAVQLQRATFGPVRQGTMAFTYDCPPHDLGMSTFRRLGIKPNCSMRRFAKLMRADRLLANRLGTSPPVQILAKLMNPMLAARTSGSGRQSDPEISLHLGRFGEEFSTLDQQVGGAQGIRSRRCAEDLNWKYRDDPLNRYEVLNARKHGELVAYLVYTISGQDAHIVDLFGVASPEVQFGLLAAVIQRLNKAAVQSVQILVSDGNGLLSMMPKCGFWARPELTRVVAYAEANSEASALIREGKNWSFNWVDVLA